MNQFSPNLMFFQKIWVPYSEESSLNSIFQDYSVQISTPDQFTLPEDKLSSPEHTWHGAAILWHKSLHHAVLHLSNTHERFTGVRLSFPGHNILAISAYLPTSGKDDDFLGCLADLSIFITQNGAGIDTILIGTDSNCSERSSSRRINGFNNFCKDHNLLKISCSEPTFHHSNGISSSNIDCFLVSRRSSTNLRNISLQCNQENPQNLSSHDPVLGVLAVPCTDSGSRQEKYAHTYTEFSTAKVIWDEDNLGNYQHAAANVLTEFESFFPAPEYIPLKCQLYSDLLVRCAEIFLEIKPPQSPKKHKHPPQLHQAWQHLRKCFTCWKREGKPRDPTSSSLLQYKGARANFQYIRRYCNNLKTIKINNKLMHTHSSDRKKHLKLIKNMRGCKRSQAPTELHTSEEVYYGSDTLEGFAKDAELLGAFVGESQEYDNEFYRLCIQDNQFIFDFKGQDDIKIPKMKIEDLEKIVDTEMKNGKACDVYRLTAEHLKYCGGEAKLVIMNLINDILEDIYYLSCPQIKAGLGTSVFKGRKKPVSLASSYRRITVSPQIGSILDRYIDPIAEEIFLPNQSPDQYGFTKKISYLMGAVLRGECQRWALDRKQTCFGVSFDGKAAFPSVDRDIQVRELYSCGESGDLLKYSKHTYENTACRMKQGGKLSREITEHKGSRQGHKRAAGHFKAYINPCLTAANNSELGFYIGPICISAICIADDTYILSNSARNLQALVNIVGHYGKRYRLVFGADKTKVTVTGSKHDMQYYQDVSFWSLYGEKLVVSEDNDHLGLVVSGLDEEIKNVDKNVSSARDSIFGFLGNIFSYKCKISPQVQFQTWSVFIKPVLRSGLSALPIRPPVLKTLTTFHNKVLRAILKLSQYSPIAPLHFLLGELPMEATLHLDILSLFWNIWSNPHTTVFRAVKYLFSMCEESSLTWTAHVRIILQLYNLPDPLLLLDTLPWSKERWQQHTKAVVTSHHESILREKAGSNLKLSYLNVQATGLSGRTHPVLSWLLTSRDVALIRPHLRMLAGDYQCYAYLSHDRGLEPHCRLCKTISNNPAPAEDLAHVLTRCRATSDIRNKYIPDLFNTVASFLPSNRLLSSTTHEHLTQFILDCSSLNLPISMRIPPNHHSFTTITRQCSLMINGIHKERVRQLKGLGLTGSKY